MIRIAVTDDMPIVLEGVRLLLDRVDDFEVVAEYVNGKDMVENIAHSGADIVLTDIDMPVMDGKTATRQLLSKFPEKKVIALSMYSDYGNYYDMISSGVRGFVLKQSSIRELEKAIRDVYSGGSFFSTDLLQNIIINLSTSAEKKSIECPSPELTKKETELLRYICQGLSNKELAEKLCVSIKTIESHKTRLIEKTSAKNTSGLIIWAIKNKIVDF